MSFKHRRAARAKLARQDRRSVKNRVNLPRLVGADRRALLTGTALASTLLIAVMATPTPAQAVACTQPASPNPIIDTNVNDNITCVNTETRTGGRRAIRLSTTANNGNDIDLNNSGTLTATSANNRSFGIQTRTRGQFSDTDIVNRGDITSSAGDDAYGIYARATGANSTITINNSGAIEATGDDDATGIGAYGHNTGNAVDIDNSGDMTVTSLGDDAVGIGVEAYGDGATANIVNSAAIVTMGVNNSIGIEVTSNGDGNTIDVDNSGDITATSSTAGFAIGIGAVVLDEYSAIDIVNSGDIVVTGVEFTYGIDAVVLGDGSAIDIVNSGDIVVTGEEVAFGISASAGDQYNYSDYSAISITNSGAITVSGGLITYGIGVYTLDTYSPIDIVNSGPISATSATANAYGIDAFAGSRDSAISITNSGAITVSGGNSAYGINAFARGRNNTIDIVNTGDMKVAGQNTAVGIDTYTRNRNSSVSIVNHGDLTVTAGDVAYGIYAYTRSRNSSVSIVNHGDLTVTAGDVAYGIDASTNGNNDSALGIVNHGAIAVTNTGRAYGISAYTRGTNSAIDIVNSGDIAVIGGDYAVGIDVSSFISRVDVANSGDITATADYAYGIRVDTFSAPIGITNSGSIRATGTGNGNAAGIYAASRGLDAPINIVNSGDISAKGSGDYAAGIAAFSRYGSVRIENSGSIFAEGTAGEISGISTGGGTGVTIINSGTISASSQLAIIVDGPGAANIYNSGTITGFVDLSDQGDTFTNQSGGVFEAKRTSLFDDGDDLFRNESGGTVHALRNGVIAPSFAGLERFENRGTISTVDGVTGDNFTISNTVGGKDLEFVAGGGSRLAVDASLGGAGSASDTFTIEGNVSGTTKVTINNTNFVGGEFNPTGIQIVTVTGATPNANAFTLDAPVDAGFFDYDLFFTPTGSGFWSLKSFPGAGAQLLPQLVTAAQDIWHQGSSTWFDRTTDLRVLVNGGAANTAYSQDGAAQGDGVAPAVWARGSGSWLDRDGSGSTSANGRNYKFNLDRDLQTLDFQVGLDMGSRDLLSQGDTLVFGVLGGFVQGSLDYDNINRNFDFNGGQIGAYATYIKGGLFVDTLLNVHLMELDANGALGFPNNDLDATTVGLRTDAGYRFGSFSGGAFLEPLATLEVTWADIDGFALGGNSVKFDDDANVRGRLGLRAGTTMEAWDGTMMEPFVTGSLWGNLSGDNQATLASNGSTFRYEDNIDDVWGELSAGVNFFNFSETTSVFAKVDVTFGDDVSGVGGKAGMRVAW